MSRYFELFSFLFLIFTKVNKKQKERIKLIIIPKILKYETSFCSGNPFLIMSPLSIPATPANKQNNNKYIIGYFINKSFIFKIFLFISTFHSYRSRGSYKTRSSNIATCSD